MDILNSNTSIKILEIKKMSWDKSNVYVSARPYHALAYRIKGKGRFNVNDKIVETNEGDAVLMPAKTGYYAQYSERNEIYVIHFHSEDTLDLNNYSLNSNELLYNLFKSAYSIWQKKESVYYYDSMAIFYQILSQIDKLSKYKLQNSNNIEFYKTIEFLNNNFTNPDITVEMLANMAKMSSTYFRRLVNEKLNTTPSIYILNLRLGYAEKLLSTGNHTVNEVAYMSGFNDPKYFSRVVKKIYGCPPSKLYIHYK